MKWQLGSRRDRPSSLGAPRASGGWLVRVKAAAQGGLLLLAEVAGATGSAVGVPLAAVTGKVYLAVLVALFGLGCCVRFVRLRRRLRQPARVSEVPPKPVSAWLAPAVGVLSGIEVALLVEATRLPVRADQPGFSTANWWWVLAGFLVLFWLQRSWLRDHLAGRLVTER